MFSPTYNDYQTPTSNNDTNNYDSWISLRPINLNNSSSQVLVVTNTTRFEAPDISSMKTFMKAEENTTQTPFLINTNNRHMKKAANIHHDIMNKRKIQAKEFKDDIDFYQLEEEVVPKTTNTTQVQQVSFIILFIRMKIQIMVNIQSK